IHDLTAVRFPELCSGDPLFYPQLLRRALAAGAWAHTVSSFVAAEVVDLLGADPERVVVVPEAVPPVAAADPARGRARAGADRYVLALSPVEPRKGHPSLVRAFDQLAAREPDVALVIAGADGWGADRLDDALGSMSPEHRARVRRLGYVGHDDRAA